MAGFYSMIDAVVAAFGVYMIYGWFLLVTKGEVKEGLLLPKEMPFKRCRDKAGFISYVKTKLLLIGIATVACGILGLVNDFTGLLGGWYILVTLIFVALMIWFGATVKKAQKLFF